MTINLASKKNCRFDVRMPSVREPNVKHRVYVPISLSLMGSITPEGLKSMSHMQISISESSYPHGCNLHMKIENIRLVGFSSPTLIKLFAPKTVALPINEFSVSARLGGIPEACEDNLVFELINPKGKACASNTVPIANSAISGFACKGLVAGDYMIAARVVDKGGKVLTEIISPVKFIDGPAAK